MSVLFFCLSLSFCRSLTSELKSNRCWCFFFTKNLSSRTEIAKDAKDVVASFSRPLVTVSSRIPGVFRGLPVLSCLEPSAPSHRKSATRIVGRDITASARHFHKKTMPLRWCYVVIQFEELREWVCVLLWWPGKTHWMSSQPPCNFEETVCISWKHHGKMFLVYIIKPCLLAMFYQFLKYSFRVTKV